MAEEAEISVGSRRAIVTQNLGIGRTAAKYVSECWEPKSRESLVRNHGLQCAKSIVDFSANIITGDETWIYGYNPETKSQ